MFFSKAREKKVREEKEEREIIEYFNVPNQILLQQLFRFENSIASCPSELLKEVVKRIDASYNLVGLECIEGEGAILKVTNLNNDSLCLKIVRYEYNIFIKERKEIKKDDAWRIYQEAVGKFHKRFIDGAGFQKKISRAIQDEKRENILVPEVSKISTDPFLYLEMAWLDGVNIIRWLKEKNDVIYSLGLFGLLLEMIEFIHDKGIIHRDIKGKNIMIAGKSTKDEKIALLDWTTAKIKGSEGRTVQGEGLGTYPYASFKQLARREAKDATELDDIHSLGIVLWEFWHARYAPQLSEKEFENEAIHKGYIVKLEGTLPKELQAIFHKATNFDERLRYVSVKEMFTDFSVALKNLLNKKEIDYAKIKDENAYFSDIKNDTKYSDMILDVDAGFDIDRLIECVLNEENKGLIRDMLIVLDNFIEFRKERNL